MFVCFLAGSEMRRWILLSCPSVTRRQQGGGLVKHRFNRMEVYVKTSYF